MSLEDRNLSPYKKKKKKKQVEERQKSESESLQNTLAQLGNCDQSKLHNSIMTFNDCLGKQYRAQMLRGVAATLSWATDPFGR